MASNFHLDRATHLPLSLSIGSNWWSNSPWSMEIKYCDASKTYIIWRPRGKCQTTIFLTPLSVPIVNITEIAFAMCAYNPLVIQQRCHVSYINLRSNLYYQTIHVSRRFFFIHPLIIWWKCFDVNFIKNSLLVTIICIHIYWNSGWCNSIFRGVFLWVFCSILL